jgi:hypothetical protein
VSVSGTVRSANADPVRLWRAQTEMLPFSAKALRRAGAADLPERDAGHGNPLCSCKKARSYTISSTSSQDTAQVRFVFQEIPDDAEELCLR